MFVPRKILEKKLQSMLTEDIGQGDITTALIVPASSVAEATVIAEQTGVIAGMEEAEVLLKSLDLEAEILVQDGKKIAPRSPVLKITGNTRTILSAERTLLNIISRMSGIATTVREAIEKIQRANFKTRVACTRKVAPGLLYFDKKAVLIGGGDTHRLHLDDMILIKDNHILVAGGVKETLEKTKKSSFSKKTEVEVTNAEEALAAAEAGADIVMLDNMSPEEMRHVIGLISGRAKTEASGGITLDNVREAAATGVDIVSIGALTHSSKALDISLELEPQSVRLP